MLRLSQLGAERLQRAGGERRIDRPELTPLDPEVDDRLDQGRASAG